MHVLTSGRGRAVAGCSRAAPRPLLSGVLAEISTVSRDGYSLLRHSRAVACTSERLAVALGLDARTRGIAYLAGLLHDAGKTRTRPETLFKRGPLMPDEREHMREHPVSGFLLLRGLGERHVLDAVLYHHELFDGSGYPCGLAGYRIPLIARLVAVADYYEALREDRPYRSGVTRDEALRMLALATGHGKFDPGIAAAMRSMIRRATATEACRAT
jgi:putative nucleotidyltransferase with HDIG domain